MTMKKETAKAMRAIRLTNAHRDWCVSNLKRKLEYAHNEQVSKVFPRWDRTYSDDNSKAEYFANPIVRTAHKYLSVLLFASLPKAFRRAWYNTPDEQKPLNMCAGKFVTFRHDDLMSVLMVVPATGTLESAMDNSTPLAKPLLPCFPVWTTDRWGSQAVPLSSVETYIRDANDGTMPKTAEVALRWFTNRMVSLRGIREDIVEAAQYVDDTFANGYYGHKPKVKNLLQLYQLWPDLAQEFCLRFRVDMPTDAKIEEQLEQKKHEKIKALVANDLPPALRDVMREIAKVTGLSYDNCKEAVESKRSILDVKQEATVASTEDETTAAQEKV